MPEEKAWDKFFNPIKILKTLGLNSSTIDVVDFGCGYGTFTIPAAKIIRGKVYAIDVEPEMIRR
jgi:ubiquinone/menaquinone biosynthesis C-methylase UbiE